MVEVFKTDVCNQKHAAVLIQQIHKTLPHCKANFHLDDCDRILRIECIKNQIDNEYLIALMAKFGFWAEPLPDDDLIPMSNCLQNINQTENAKRI